MQPTLVIAIAATIAMLLLLGALGLVLTVGGVMLVRNRRRPRRRHVDDDELSQNIDCFEAEEPVETIAPRGADAPVEALRPPPMAGGLLGFFDDEVSSAEDGTRTELFQRGKLAEYWDEEDEAHDGEATEIFSAHGAAGDLAEFAFDDNEESTGRFST